MCRGLGRPARANQRAHVPRSTRARAATCWIVCTAPEDRSASSSTQRSPRGSGARSEEHTSELQSRLHLVCRLLLEKKIQDEIHQCMHVTAPAYPGITSQC